MIRKKRIAVLFVTACVFASMVAALFAPMKPTSNAVPNGTPIFVADSASIEDFTLTLNEALELDPSLAKSLVGAVPPRFRRKSIVYCSDPIAAESLKVLQAGTISLASTGLAGEPVANFLRDTPKPVDLTRGVVTVIDVAHDGTVAREETARLTAIRFQYALRN